MLAFCFLAALPPHVRLQCYVSMAKGNNPARKIFNASNIRYNRIGNYATWMGVVFQDAGADFDLAEFNTKLIVQTNFYR